MSQDKTQPEIPVGRDKQVHEFHELRSRSAQFKCSPEELKAAAASVAIAPSGRAPVRNLEEQVKQKSR